MIKMFHIDKLFILTTGVALMFSTVWAGQTTLRNNYPPLMCNSQKNSLDLSLKDYIVQAASQNGELRSAYNRWQAAYFNVRYSDTLPDPKLSYGYFIQEVETRVGPQKQRLGISQTIPWFGKLRHRKNVAAQAVVVAEENFSFKYVSLVKRIKKAFYDYYYLSRAIDITQENIHLLELVESVAQSQAIVGGSAADVLQAQMEISKLKDELDTLYERSTIAEARINAILNQNVAEPVLLPSSLFDGLNIPQQVDEAELIAVSPELRIISAEVIKQQLVQKLTHQNRFPDVSLGLDWIQTDRAIMPTPDSGKDPVIAKLSISVPIWLSTYSSQENEAAYIARSVEDQFEQLKYVILADFKDILLKYKEMEREISLYKDELIPQAEQTLSILQEAYEAGKADFERYLGAQRLLLDFQLKLENAHVQRASIIADYDSLLGRCGY